MKKRTEVLENAAKKRSERHARLKAMEPAQLAAELVADSAKGREPFNSSAFAETVSRGEAAVPALAQSITPDRKSLLALLALRRSRGAAQRVPQAVRVTILIDALRSSRYFNTWGMPHLEWFEAAQAIIAEGQAAEKPLVELLSDTREAPMWGSEYSNEYARYKYRVRDYAWALLAAIRQQKVTVPMNPAERDALIERMRASPPR
ncbi:MAG TPA: hypothetical protein VJZ76_03535 [Thermoanaerobaculia bacterium]|nr:hypothetical protein [Thermoanaerobaculia bacterium]